MYEFAEESSLEVLEECYPLCEAHFHELNIGKAFEVDWTTLQAFINAKMMVVVTVRVEGKIVAYYMNLLNRDFLTNTLTAKEMSIYVHPDYRGGRLFFKLHKYNTEVLKTKGVVTQYITFMCGYNDKLPLKLGFEPLEITYKKSI